MHEAAPADERYRALFAANPHPMWFFDTKTLAFLEVNDAAVAQYGFRRDEFLAMTIADIRPPEDVSRLRGAVGRVAESAIDEAGIWRHRKKDGSILLVEIVSHALEYDGRPAELVLVRDMTARLNAEAALRESQAELEKALQWQRQIFEGSRDAVFLSDEEGRFVDVNGAATDMTGFSRDELLTMTIPDLHEDPDLAAYRTFHRRILEGEHVLSEAPIRRKDGRKVAVEFNNSLVVIGGKRFMHTSGRDATDRVRLEEQLRQAQKMEAIGKLAGGVAHDFNNLLTVISGNCELLLSSTPAGDPRRGSMADIRAAGERAASLTRQLLAFSRKQILEPRVVDVHEVVTGIQKMLGRLIGEDVDLLTNLAAEESWVKVDPGQLEQVVMNLVVNARDAMPRGGRITIRTRNVDAPASAGDDETEGRRARPGVAISISDTGSGLTPEVKAHLFEPFFTTKAAGKGTGLGLATVYGIVKQSGGDVTVESEPGKGATFMVVLPSHPGPRTRDASLAQKALPRGTETVLVVEDEDAVRRVVKIALETTGYRVIEARNGTEALEVARTHAGRIHLVVTDVVMPEMSGRELAGRLTKDFPGLRILYMSGYTDDAVVRHGIVDARVEFLQKPFSPLALTRKVREALDGAD